jgi:DNA modification methylase
VIIVGDARNTGLPDRSVDLVVTSPPYFGLRTYGALGEIGGEDTPAEYVKAMVEVLDEMRRVLKPDGSVFLVIGDKYARTGGVDKKIRGTGDDPGGRAHGRPVQRGVTGVKDGSLVGLPFRVALAAVDAGWVWRQEIVWRKPNPLPESVRNRCQRAHETILHLSLTNRPYSRVTQRGGELGHDVWDYAVAGYKDPAGRKHPAVFPEPLVERVITDYCPPGGTVLDPFAGSGTTLAVASRLGHTWCGIELNPEYAAIAHTRVYG